MSRNDEEAVDHDKESIRKTLKNEVSLKLYSSFFHPGDSLSGLLTLHLENPTQFLSVFLDLKGVEFSVWDESVKRTVNFQTEESTLKHRGLIDIISKRLQIITPDTKVRSGRTEIPFQIPLPNDLPDSVEFQEEGKRAGIRYTLKAVTEGVNIPIQCDSLKVIISNSHESRPSHTTKTFPLSILCCIEKGRLLCSLSIEKNVCSLGDSLKAYIDFDCSGGLVGVRRIDLKLIRTAILKDSEGLAQVSIREVGHQRRVVNVEPLSSNLPAFPVILQIPETEETCGLTTKGKFVQVTYTVVLEALLNNALTCMPSPRLEIPVTIIRGGKKRLPTNSNNNS